MTVEFPDLPPADVPPCETCGSTVHLEVEYLPRRFGEAHPRSTQKRVCDNGACSTNSQRNRRLGDVV